MKSWFKTPPKPTAPDFSVYGTYSEEQLDLVDALAPIYDQLVINRARWWGLEIVPLLMWSVVKRTFESHKNWGRGRTILPPVDAALTDAAAAMAKFQAPLVRVHRTVRARMAWLGNDKTPQYVPNALLNGLTLDKVDPKLIE